MSDSSKCHTIVTFPCYYVSISRNGIQEGCKMKKINVLILVLLTVFLVSCNNEEDMSITSSDFFSETSITEFYLEAEFIDQEEEDAFFDNLRGFVIEYTILEGTLIDS